MIHRRMNKNEENNDEENDLVLPPELELRAIGIYGDINEERCSEAVYGLLALHDSGRYFVACESDEGEEYVEEHYKPIDFYISTYGGAASDMFGVYDLMKKIRQLTPVHTHGVGKVMSAGVLLLAAGTKGERHIGEHCRVMIHGVISGHNGHIADMENEFGETKIMQKLYVQALAAETNMDEKYIKKLINKKTNVYFDAKEAVKLGIADKIF